jgi:bifunctional non-homologous end joining protein LigD
MPPPQWIKPQLTKLSTKAPSGPNWVHEVKFDGYRMAARIDQGNVKLLTRSGLDWTAKYPGTAAAFAKLKVRSAYVDGELCGVRPDGVTSFELMQTASDRGGDGLMFFAFDLLELDGENIARLPLGERKKRLKALLDGPPDGIAFSDHEAVDGEVFREAACKHGLEGIVSKRLDRPYLPGDRGAWVKTKCLNRAEFVVVGWSDPEGAAASRRAAARVLRARRTTGLRRPGRHGHEPEDAGDTAQYACSRSRSERCRSPRLRLATTASAGLWN